MGVTAGIGMLLLAVVGAAQVAAVDDASRFQAYSGSFASEEDACAAAERGEKSRAPGAVAPSVAADACSRRANWKTVEIAGSIAGTLALGLGIYWLATAPDRPEKKRVVFLPHVQPGAAGVDLAVRF